MRFMGLTCRVQVQGSQGLGFRVLQLLVENGTNVTFRLALHSPRVWSGNLMEKGLDMRAKLEASRGSGFRV